MSRPVIPNPPGELDMVKLAALNAISWANADGHPIVLVSMATGKARSMTEAQFEAATGFGGLFEEGEG